MLVEVKVHVPNDRVVAFHSAFASFVTTGEFDGPATGSESADWQEISIQVVQAKICRFYVGFADWLETATTRPTTKPAPIITAAALQTAYRTLPSIEKEILKLFADDSGRTVGWPELQTKFGLPGKPSIARALPYLSEYCRKQNCTLPVEQTGKDDDAVFSLPFDLLRTVSLLRT